MKDFKLISFELIKYFKTEMINKSSKLILKLKILG